jgi:hypothetical protein
MGVLMETLQHVVDAALPRRGFLVAAARTMLLTLASATGGIGEVLAQDHKSSPDGAEQRIASIIEAYDAQGDHRTGTSVDNDSAKWLSHEVRQAGIEPTLEPFTLSRVDPASCYVRVADRRIDGVPLFDAAFTDEIGISGTVGALGSDADFALVESEPNNFAEPRRERGGTIADARRSRHKGVIVLTDGTRPGLFLLNALFFKAPSGPPMLQVSSAEREWLKALAQNRAKATLVAHVKRSPAQAFNVTARIAGADPDLSPLVVVTPRSGWWHCASERGGGIACWLEAIRALAIAKPARDCIFVAFSGHELGFFGIESYLRARPELVKRAHAWIFLGANIGSPRQPNLIQVSDTSLEAAITDSLGKQGIAVNYKGSPESAKRGETTVLEAGGARYAVLACGSDVFHNAADRWPDAVDVSLLTRYAKSIANGAVGLAGQAG